MRDSSCLVVVGLIGLLNAGCGVVVRPPPEPPKAKMPTGYEPRTTPPEAGTTRFVLDANGEKANVQEVLTTTTVVSDHLGSTAMASAETLKPVCLAPCVADLQPGLHVLRFSSADDGGRVSDVEVQVGDRSRVVRHAIGHKPETNGVALFFGLLLMGTGGSLALTGGAVTGLGASKPETDEDRKGMIAGGSVLMGAGVAAIVGAIPLMLMGRTVIQSGATTEMPLPVRF